MSIAFWVGPQKVQRILTEGGSNGLVHGSAQVSLGDVQELLGPNVPIEFVYPGEELLVLHGHQGSDVKLLAKLEEPLALSWN